MDFMKEAFGGFEPQDDPRAPIKFVLNVIAMDRRWSELSKLLQLSSPVEGMEGEPGWIIERYESNVHGVFFKATVDPEIYQLKYPDCKVSDHELKVLTDRIARAFSKRFPDEGDLVRHLYI